AGPIGPSTTTNVGAGSPPFGIAKVTDRTLHQIRLINPRFDSSTTTFAALSGGQFEDFTHEGGSAEVAAWYPSFGNVRGAKYVRPRVRFNTDGFYFTVGATGCTDVLVDDPVLVCPVGVCMLHIHEGTAQARVRGGGVFNAGTAAPNIN